MRSYRWTRPSWLGRDWRLMDGGRVVAGLRWRSWSRAFDLVVEGVPWSVRMEGFWRRRLIVLDRHGVQRYAVRLHVGGAEVEGHAWGTLRWRRTTWWGRATQLEAAGRPLLARIQVHWTGADTQVDPKAPDALALACVGWGIVLIARAAASSG